MNFDELMQALSLADAVCATDEAWNAIYTRAVNDHPGEDIPPSKVLQDAMHDNVHNVIKSIMGAMQAMQGLAGMGGMLNAMKPDDTPAPAPEPQQAPHSGDNQPFPGMYL